jgi:putative thioredoxin
MPASSIDGDGAVFDVDEADFEQRVVRRSSEVPVVVDFWADWCGPCKALSPALQRAAASRVGKVELAKVDVDSNQRLAAQFRVQGIPAVKAFRDGQVVSEFTGALPPAEVERFFDALVPSEADELAARGAAVEDEAALRRALELDPNHQEARRALGALLLRRGEAEKALELLRPAGEAGDFLADGLAARAALALAGDDALEPAFAAWDQGDHAAALELLQAELEGEQDAERRDLIRRVMVGIFTELGPDNPLAREHRRRLAAALN